MRKWLGPFVIALLLGGTTHVPSLPRVKHVQAAER